MDQEWVIAAKYVFFTATFVASVLFIYASYHFTRAIGMILKRLERIEKALGITEDL